MSLTFSVKCVSLDVRKQMHMLGQHCVVITFVSFDYIFVCVEKICIYCYLGESVFLLLSLFFFLHTYLTNIKKQHK